MIDLARKAAAEVLFLHGFPVSAQDALEGMEVEVALAAIYMARQEAAKIAAEVILAARMGDIDTDLRSIGRILESSINAGKF